MAHSCPECGCACYCGGDIDDICFDEAPSGCSCCLGSDFDEDEDYEYDERDED